MQPADQMSRYQTRKITALLQYRTLRPVLGCIIDACGYLVCTRFWTNVTPEETMVRVPAHATIMALIQLLSELVLGTVVIRHYRVEFLSLCKTPCGPASQEQ
jgi:hypothetical protein